MPFEFLTLPDELQSLANRLFTDLRARGYTAKREPHPLELPSTPSIRAKRRHETHYFLVRQAWAIDEVEQWHRYCCSCATETRLSICSSVKTSAKHLTALRKRGVGLIRDERGALHHECETRDLAFHARAPSLASLKPKVRTLLGESLERLERGDWRPAFEDACGVLEEECRSYLLRGLKVGRVKYQAGSKTKVPTAAQIRKLTLGALKNIFCGMVNQNQIEAHLCSALTKLNPDRVRRTHRKQAKAAEAAVRKRVGIHFWLINNSLALLV